ncbi:MAG TPA: LysE family transporter [Bacteroidota bacterium]|nr:LysE family transporter [Bacteroidota bacterium]
MATMRNILVEVCAYLMGFLAAIPLGATQLEIARRSLSGFPRAALMVVAGSVLSDVMYGVFAFLGIAPFLRDAKVVGVFWSLNALILVVLALFALRSSASRETRTASVPLSLHDRRASFVVGFSLAVTNPLMIVWWLLGARVLTDVGLMTPLTPLRSGFFLLAGGSGIASYLTLLTFGIYRAKQFLSERVMRRITVGLGAGLVVLALYSAVRSWMALTGSG